MKSFQKGYKYFVVIVLVMPILAASILTSNSFAAPAGPPARPAPGPSPDPSLAVHNLAYAPGPLDNPIKGFAPYFFKGTNYETKPLPHSMLWSYFALSEIQNNASDCNSFDWSILEQMLDETASTGRQAMIRFYVEYPGGTGSHPANGIPPCVNGKVAMRTNGYWGTTSPDYDDPDMIDAFTKFINAFGAKYDGDPRIAVIHMGLVGLWGEWHTWPYDQDTSDGYPNLFPTDATVCSIVHAYDAAFSKTQLDIRYGDLACAAGAGIGFHDDSWPYKEFRSGDANAHGMTLPVSLGGWPDAFLQRQLNPGDENQWINQGVSGEVRPEIQGNLPAAWPNGAGQVDNVKAAIELGHFSTSINEQGVGGYNATDPNVQAILRLMGYELYVSNSYFNSTISGSFKVGVKIENRAVARFYYPWTVIIGLKDGSGNVVQTWNTNWDITKVQPLQIRAFPDWNVGADPTYLPFGYPMYYDATLSAAGVPSGNYSLVMRVKNPLEDVTEASVRDNIQSWQPFLPAKKLRFANAEQNADGWLNLGSVSVNGGGPTWTPGPTNTPGPTATKTNTPPPPTATATRTNTPLPATSTNTAVPPTATPVGLLSYEAEASNNTLAGGAVVAACSSCSGGNKVGYVGNNSGTLQFNGVSANSTGNYTLTMYYTNGDSVVRNATISVNGGAGTSISFPVTGGWTTVGSVATTISLNSGNSNTIKFSNATGWAPDFDRITVNSGGGATATNTAIGPTATKTNTPTGPTATATQTPTKTNTPTGPTNTPTKTNTPVPPTNTPTPSSGTSYEAEAAGNTLGGGATIQNCTACSGGQRVNSIGFGINNAYLIFINVNVATAGNHTVVVWYTNGNNTSLTFHADPNGNSGPTTTVPSNGGFDWTQPVLSVTITLNLNAGNNTIRIWDNNKAPDIDRIVVQ